MTYHTTAPSLLFFKYEYVGADVGSVLLLGTDWRGSLTAFGRKLNLSHSLQHMFYALDTIDFKNEVLIQDCEARDSPEQVDWV
jgi:hypothetical protein